MHISMRFLATAGCVLATAACSTTYHVAPGDVERIARGAEVKNVRSDAGEAIDFSTYSFVYRDKDSKAPLRVKGVESLNGLAGAGKLTDMMSLDLEPSLADRAWQRTLLGGAVGLAAGAGVGFAVSNRVIIERTALAGGSCPACGPEHIAVGTVVSGVIGATVGALIAYFGRAGSVRTATVDLIGGEPASEPASEPTSAPASAPTTE